MFGNDYASVSKAARANSFVNLDTKLGRSFAAFARKLVGAPDLALAPKLGFLRGLGSKPAPQPQV